MVLVDIVGRCFNYLATDHVATDCTNPSRCLRYKQEGHHVRTCRHPCSLQEDLGLDRVSVHLRLGPQAAGTRLARHLSGNHAMAPLPSSQSGASSTTGNADFTALEITNQLACATSSPPLTAASPPRRSSHSLLLYHWATWIARRLRTTASWSEQRRSNRQRPSYKQPWLLLLWLAVHAPWLTSLRCTKSTWLTSHSRKQKVRWY